MPSKTFEVEVHGLDVLKAKLDSKRFLGPVREELIAHAAKVGTKVAEEKSKGQRGTKGFKGRIETTFDSNGLVAHVFPQRSIGGIPFVIEEGRRPGRRPPYRGIKKWLGGSASRDAIEGVRRDIMAHGTKGVHYMAQAQEQHSRRYVTAYLRQSAVSNTSGISNGGRYELALDTTAETK